MIRRVLVICATLLASNLALSAEDPRCGDVMHFGKVGAAGCPSYKTDNARCSSASWASTYGGKACLTIANEKCTDAMYAKASLANANVCKAVAKYASTTTTSTSAPPPTRDTSGGGGTATCGTAAEDAQCVQVGFFGRYGAAKCPSYKTDNQKCSSGAFAQANAPSCRTIATEKCVSKAWQMNNPANSSVCQALRVRYSQP